MNRYSIPTPQPKRALVTSVPPLQTMFPIKSTTVMTLKEPIVITLPDWCNTQSKVVKYSVDWSMDSDVEYPNEMSSIRSPVFSFGAGNELQACIVLYPRGVPLAENKEMASLYLEIVSSNEKSITGKLEFVFSSASKASMTQEMLLTQDNITPGLGWGFTGICTHSYVFQEILWAARKKNLYKWLVGCSISLVEDTLSAHSADKPNLIGTPALVDHQKLLESGTFSDVTLVVGGERLRAHKNILSARSPVFEAMFVGEMEEARGNVVNIVDFDAGVIKEVLNFIYTGRADLQNCSADGLLGAADKYGLNDLKAMCEDSLGKNLTVENVGQIFRLADLYRAQELMVNSAEFMRRNIKTVKNTDGWRMLKNTFAKLLVEVMIERGLENQ